MKSPLDLYPRARYCAYDAGEGWLCADCATQEYGIKTIWQALHLIDNHHGVRQIPLGTLLGDSPLEPCRECLRLLWDTLPEPVSVFDTEFRR